MGVSEQTESRNVFVTVGTTQFDELIDHVLHPDTLEVVCNNFLFYATN